MKWNILWHQALIHSKFGLLQTKKGNTISFQLPVNQDGTALRFKLETLGNSKVQIGSLGVWFNGKAYPARLHGKDVLIIPGASSVWTDPIELPLKAGNMIEIRIFCRNRYADGNAIEEKARWYAGNAVTASVPTPAKQSRVEQRTGAYPYVPCLTEIDILSSAEPETIVAFGDSITAMSRWTKPLARRLNEAFGDKATLVNSGISGNCIGWESGGLMKHQFGTMGKKRYSRDVMSLPDVKTVILAFGINDISFMTERNVSVWNLDRLKETESQMIRDFHNKGIRVVGVTLGPRKGFGKWTEEQEVMRREYNMWLRENAELDALVDPEPFLLEKGTTDEYATSLHQGDHLHPNSAGGQIIADCFDLSALLGGSIHREEKP